MAEKGTAEASSADHQRLCWAMRCAERGRNYQLIGHGVAREYRQLRAVPEPAGVGGPLSRCGRNVSPAARIPPMQASPVLPLKHARTCMEKPSRSLLKKPLPVPGRSVVRSRDARRRSAIANRDVQLRGVEERIPADHPLRGVRKLVEVVWRGCPRSSMDCTRRWGGHR